MKRSPYVLIAVIMALVCPMAEAAPTSEITHPSESAHDRKIIIDTAPSWNVYDTSEQSSLVSSIIVQGRPAIAMVDTGVAFTMLDKNWVKQAALRVSEGTILDQSVSLLNRGPVVCLDMPPYHVTNFQTFTEDLSSLSQARTHIDLLLGLDFVRNGSMELNLGSGKWRLGPSGLSLPEAFKAPLQFTANRYATYVEINVNGQSLRLGIDTGLDSGLLLTEHAAGLTGIFESSKTTTIATQGITGIAVTRLAIPGSLTFGTITLADVPVEIEQPNGLPTTWGVDGLVGLDLLRRLHAVLDFPAGRFLYGASPTPAVKPTRSTIGIQTRRAGDRLSIIHVMANGPAAKAGWKSGDEICAVNGVAIKATPASGGPKWWSVARPGTTITFKMCDGSTYPLIADDFY